MPVRRLDEFLRRMPSSAREELVKGIDELLEEALRRHGELVKREVLGELESIALAVSDLARKIDEVSARLAKLEEAVKKLEQGKRREKDPIAEKLASEGFLLASEIRGMNPQAVIEAARNMGALVLDLGFDAAIVDRKAFREFQELLEEAKTSDEEEVRKALGRFYKLFRALRRAGMVYYDSKKKCWRIA